jgi:hypothetical protein
MFLWLSYMQGFEPERPSVRNSVLCMRYQIFCKSHFYVRRQSKNGLPILQILNFFGTALNNKMLTCLYNASLSIDRTLCSNWKLCGEAILPLELS